MHKKFFQTSALRLVLGARASLWMGIIFTVICLGLKPALSGKVTLGDDCDDWNIRKVEIKTRGWVKGVNNRPRITGISTATWNVDSIKSPVYTSCQNDANPAHLCDTKVSEWKNPDIRVIISLVRPIDKKTLKFISDPVDLDTDDTTSFSTWREVLDRVSLKVSNLSDGWLDNTASLHVLDWNS